MAGTIRHVKVLLSSPGNLKADRQVIREVVETINRDSGQRSGFHAEVVSWETHTRPAAGDYAQGVINDQFPEDVDIFVGLMGAYFGSPTPNYNSGTEEEFYLAHNSWKKTESPEIMFYFSTQSASLSGIDPDQLKLVAEFKKKIADEGIYYFQYENELGLRLDLHPQLSQAIHEALKKSEDKPSSTAVYDESLHVFSYLDQLLVSDPVVAASELFRSATNAIDDHTVLQKRMTKLVAELATKVESTSRTLTGNNKIKQKTKAVETLVSSMQEYQMQLRSIIPRKQRAIIESMTSVQRAVTVIKENSLEEEMPYHSIVGSIDLAAESFESLRASILTANEGFEDWPNDMGELTIQKKLVCAIHLDLDEYYFNAATLLRDFRKTL